MLLESSSLSAADPARDAPPMPAGNARARRGAGSAPFASAASASSYSRVRDEVEAGERTNRTAQTPPADAAKGFSLWQNGDFGFGDFIDVINPLQHLPIVSTIYRNLSGDQIGMGSRVIGGALWGRVGGFVAGIVNSVVEWFTGKDIGDHIYSAIWGKPDGTAVAQAPKPEPQPSAPAVAEAAPVVIPISGGEKKSLESERHSAIMPGNLLSRRIEKSFYRRDDERDDKRNLTGAKALTVRLRA
jgi:hypothetical protein